MSDSFDARLVMAKEAYGDCIEVGVHNGSSAVRWAAAFKPKKYFAFDTFNGMPVGKLLPEEEHLKSIGAGYRDPIEKVFKFLQDHGVTPVAGVFPDEVLDKIPRLIAFAYLDADNYLTTLQAMYLVRQRLAVGGVIVIHDYYHTDPTEGAPGVQRAVNEFLKEFPQYKMLVNTTGDLVMLCR